LHQIDSARELRHAMPIAQNFLRHRLRIAAKLSEDLVAPLLFLEVTLPAECRPFLRPPLVCPHRESPG
jgi:hypothetical protein